MNANENTISDFYHAFKNGDAAKMASFYHPEIQFRDPVFGLLKAEEVLKMWQMLFSKNGGTVKIEVSKIKADDFLGTARWVTTYNFKKSNRKVVNIASAEFLFKDGLIIKHTDSFDMWHWAQQAFGFKGFMLGWTAFFQKKVQEEALRLLHNYK